MGQAGQPVSGPAGQRASGPASQRGKSGKLESARTCERVRDTSVCSAVSARFLLTELAVFAVEEVGADARELSRNLEQGADRVVLTQLAEDRRAGGCKQTSRSQTHEYGRKHTRTHAHGQTVTETRIRARKHARLHAHARKRTRAGLYINTGLL